MLHATISGPLAQIPLGVLVTKAASTYGAWLGQERAVILTPSVSGFRALRSLPRTPRKTTLIAIGDPQIDTTLAADGPRLGPLRFAAEEIRRLKIAVGTGQVRLLVGPQATKMAVMRADLSSVGVLEFATHAIQRGDSATVSDAALVLSPPTMGSAPRHSYLTSAEVAGLRVGADLVLLSACETAYRADVSDSLSGLAEAFLFAGARGVVATLWTVADEAALNLVGEAFVPPLEGVSEAFAEGLRRRIDRLVRQDPLSPKANPRYWGPFVVMGG
jgi:CHAT domain-containing protein